MPDETTADRPRRRPVLLAMLVAAALLVAALAALALRVRLVTFASDVVAMRPRVGGARHVAEPRTLGRLRQLLAEQPLDAFQRRAFVNAHE